eukprot:jgi/Chlat1/8593/Chrsp86S07995
MAAGGVVSAVALATRTTSSTLPLRRNSAPTHARVKAGRRAVACSLKDCAEEKPQQQQQAPSFASSLPGFAAAAAAAAVALSLAFAEPSLAYKGGGPMGQKVTRGQDLTGQDFHGLDLTKADFKTSVLRQANLAGAKLVGATFFDADLTGADFSNTDMRTADLSLANAFRTNFTNADLTGAFVTGNTQFKEAIVEGADFTDVLLRDDQRKLLCKSAKG